MLRKNLGYSQKEFANKIGMSQGGYSDIENSRTSLTEKNIKLISKEFKANEDWLKTGEGEMFKEDDFFYDLGYYTQDASDLDKAIIIELLKLNKNEKETILKYWKNVINKLDK
jgi:transcriptional regulator with XRE-family HTH domain